MILCVDPTLLVCYIGSRLACAHFSQKLSIFLSPPVLRRWRVSFQVRGQEGDLWKGQVNFTPPDFYPFGKHRKQDLINRQFMTKTAEMPQWITFDLGLEFIERNKDADNWFLQLETFDPHEPFFTQQVSMH